MLSIIKSTINLYLKNFWLYLKIIFPLLIPVAVLPLIGHYTSLGRLNIVFSTLFGIILIIIGMFIEIIMISASYQLIKAGNVKVQIPLQQKWKQAGHKFFSYLYLKIITTVIVLSLPLIVKSFQNYLPNYIFNPLRIIAIAWIAVFTLLFLFSTYILIIENQQVISAIKKSKELFLRRPFGIILKLAGGIVCFGAILIVMSIITEIILAVILKQTYILFNPYLSPWWQKLTMNVYTLLGLPLLVILMTIIFADLTAIAKAKHESKTSDRTGDTYPVKN